MYQDLTTHHDWPIKKAIVDLPIRLKGNWKPTSSNLLSLLGAQSKDLSTASQMLLTRVRLWVSVRKQPTFGDTTTGFPVKWRLRSERSNSILMTRHYPDLGSASDWLCHLGNLIQPIKSTTQIWVVTHHHYGNSALVSQMSFGRETSGSGAKWWLFSQTNYGCVTG